jgi:hypothetical protein
MRFNGTVAMTHQPANFDSFADVALLAAAGGLLVAWMYSSRRRPVRRAPYAPKVRPSPPQYPGIPRVLTDALGRAVDEMAVPLAGPLSIGGADPAELAEYAALIARRVVAAAPAGTLVFTPTGIDSANVDVDSQGNKQIRLVFLAHEQRSAVTIKVTSKFVVKIQGDVLIIELKPYSSPVETTVQSLEQLSKFARYDPVVSPVI